MTPAQRRFLALGFASVHDALAAESALRAAGVAALAIPSPRDLGELCGIALRIDPEQEAAAFAALQIADLTPRASAEFDDV